MVVSPSDLKRLAKTRGGSLRSLEFRGCKMFSDDGLVDIARDCIKLTSLRLDWNQIDGAANGSWLHELSLCNTVMESLYFHDPFDLLNMKDVTRLANKCSNSLVSLNGLWMKIGTKVILSSLRIFVVYVLWSCKKLHSLFYALILISYGNWISGVDIFNQIANVSFLRCPNLEVLHTENICGDKGFQLIGQFCKKLRKLTHYGRVTHLGLKAVAQGCPDLDFLNIHPSKISNDALECVGTHLKKLCDFRIFLGMKDGITDLPLDKGVRDMLMGCRKLERLDIDLCLGGLTDVGLGYIGEYGHNLRHISLGYTGESDAGMEESRKEKVSEAVRQDRMIILRKLRM
nr:hypothetical protein [Tanacetum cinerariifolium]